MAVDNATGLVVNANHLGFQNSDLATAVTGFGVECATTNCTGTIKVWGIPS